MNIAQLITNDLGLSYSSIDIRMRMAIDPSIDATISNEVAQLCCECAIQRRILMLWRHNIYASDEHPIFVRELQEIDDFFDQLDPNIEVIWGTATDDTLGEDAKVTILATGMENHLEKEVQMDVHINEDDYYEDIIKKLYKPVVKGPTMAKVITQQELEFKVEPAPEPEPAPAPEPEEDEEEPTMLSKWRAWLRDFMKDVKE